jgi:hypothetical protein
MSRRWKVIRARLEESLTGTSVQAGPDWTVLERLDEQARKQTR